jgi:hypothetical protein
MDSDYKFKRNWTGSTGLIGYSRNPISGRNREYAIRFVECEITVFEHLTSPKFL